MKLAVIGNTPLSIGIVLAADLSELGHDVVLAGASDDERETIAHHLDLGLSVHFETAQLLSKAKGPIGGFRASSSPAEAVSDAEFIFLDTPPTEIENRIDSFASKLTKGQHIHVETHGYWAAFRTADVLAAHGITGVTVSEGTTPTHAGAVKDGVITPHAVRRSLALGIFPASETARVSEKLNRLLPIFDVKRDVVETNLESMNFLVHPAIALTGIGLFNAAKQEHRLIRFYQEGNSADAGRLAEALDDERKPILAQMGFRFRSLAEQINAIYGGSGETVQEAIHAAPFYHALPDLDPDIWRHWLSWDLPFAHVPFVRLSEALGHPAPLHRGLIDILGAIMGENYWQSGLELEALGLAGLSAEGIRSFAHSGVR